MYVCDGVNRAHREFKPQYNNLCFESFGRTLPFWIGTVPKLQVGTWNNLVEEMVESTCLMFLCPEIEYPISDV